LNKGDMQMSFEPMIKHAEINFLNNGDI